MNSKYLNSDMSPIPMPEKWQAKTEDEWQDIITGFPKRLAITREEAEDQSVNIEIQKTLEEEN